MSGGTIVDIAGETFFFYNIRGGDFPAAPGNYYLVCVSTPECGSPMVSNEIVVTVTTSANDTIPPGVAGPLLSSTFTQTLCQ